MTDTPSPENYLLIGEVVAAFGIRGQVKVRSLTDNIAHLQRKIKTVYVGPKRQAHRLKQVFEHKPGLLIMTLEGVGSRTAAEDLRGVELSILEDQAVPLDEGEYFIHELYGLDVFLEDGESFGSVREVLQTGANDVLVVSRPNQPDALLPVIRDVIVSLDVPNKLVVVRLLEGLLGE